MRLLITKDYRKCLSHWRWFLSNDPKKKKKKRKRYVFKQWSALSFDRMCINSVTIFYTTVVSNTIIWHAEYATPTTTTITTMKLCDSFKAVGISENKHARASSRSPKNSEMVVDNMATMFHVMCTDGVEHFFFFLIL